MENEHNLLLHLPYEAMGQMSLLLSQGVRIPAPVGITLEQLLCDHLGLSRQYVENNIQTAFVNGRAADRFTELYIKDGDIIALSAAMPGLVGATLRKGGHLACMRAEISQAPVQKTQHPVSGFVVIKLFNQIARETGSHLLSRRFWIKAESLVDNLRRLRENGLPGPENFLLDGQVQPIDRLVNFIQSNPWVAVQFEKA